MSVYLLHHTKFIIPYNIGQIIEAIVLKSHGNSKSKDSFRPTMHSVKEDCKVKVQNNSRPARYIIDHLENPEKRLERDNGSVVLRKSHQIYKVQQNVLKNKTKEDDVLNLIVQMLNQAKHTTKQP